MRQRVADRAAAPRAAGERRGWLLLVHQLPATPSNLRVRVWRRMRQIGALPVKQAVYALPDSPAAREDFEWLTAEIAAAGGAAALFTAAHVDRRADAALAEEFRRARQDDYAVLARALEREARRVEGRRRGGPPAAVRRRVDAFRQRFAALEAIDFFGSAGRDRVGALLAALDARLTPRKEAAAAADGPATPGDVLGRLWVTRPRPGVDRMASAWLIARFIDPRAEFGFAADRSAVPDGALPFDMFGVELSHHGDGCTFETLCRRFAIADPAVARIAAIVHDLDLKDDRFAPPEAPTVGALIEGLQLAHGDDRELLARGMQLFEALYRSFARAGRRPSPRAVAGRRPRGRRR